MRIVRLDLKAFGPFDGQSLDLSADGCLHVVYGPNEAGKSTALRAIGQLIFGIPARSSDDFLHPATDLRIGGVVEDELGILECIRRKGGKNSLRGGDDTSPIDGVRWTQLIGSVDDATFRQQFGIDYEELREGGASIVEGKGDVGRILFAAAAGIADLGKVLTQLDDEAEELFKPSGKNPVINKAMGELQAAKKSLKELQLSVARYNELRDGVERAEKNRRDIDESISRRQTERQRLENLLKARGDLASRGQLFAERKDLIHVPVLPADFSNRRLEVQLELVSRESELNTATEELAAIDDELAKLDVPEEVLSLRDAIRSVVDGYSAYRKALTDRPGLEARIEQLDRTAQRLLAELNVREATWPELRKVQRVRIQELASEYQKLVTRRESVQESLRKQEGEIASLEQEVARQAPSAPTDELRAAIQRAAGAAELDRRVNDLGKETAALQRQLMAELARLSLWQGSLEKLTALRVPSEATIQQLDQRFTKSAARLESLRERQLHVQQEIRRLELDIDACSRRHVPTPEELAAVRSRRDEAWRLVKQTLDGSSPTSADMAMMASDVQGAGGLSAYYESLAAQADELADRLWRDAEQVATLESYQLQRRRHEIDHAELARQAEELQREQQAAEEEWRKAWQSVTDQPLSVAEMRQWLARHGDLCRIADTLREKRHELAQATQSAAALREELAAALVPLVPPRTLFPQALAECLDLAVKTQRQCDKQVQEQERRERDLDQARRRRDESASQVARLQEELQVWQKKWNEATQCLGLGNEALPAEIHALLATVEELSANRRESESLRERVQGIDREGAQFEREVKELAPQVLAAVDAQVELIVRQLRERLSEAESQADRRAETIKRRTAVLRRQEQAREKVEGYRAQIALLCRQARCDDPQQLPTVERQSQRRQQIESEIEAQNQRLQALCDGQELDAFLQAAQAGDVEEWRAGKLALDQELSSLDLRRTEAVEAVIKARADLSCLDGSDAAAAAQDQVQQLLARIRTSAEEYARLKLAAHLLRQAIERFRDKNQGPVLKRASELFAELTLGSFVSLRPEFDDRGESVLVGVREGGKMVAVDGMSEGTCDQLYLALKLASLEHWLEQHGPMPFIIDDILVNFDDERATAALRALADLSQQTQVIFFTHHEHLLQMAGDQLPPEQLAVHRLPGRLQPASAEAAAT